MSKYQPISVYSTDSKERGFFDIDTPNSNPRRNPLRNPKDRKCTPHCRDNDDCSKVSFFTETSVSKSESSFIPSETESSISTSSREQNQDVQAYRGFSIKIPDSTQNDKELSTVEENGKITMDMEIEHNIKPTKSSSNCDEEDDDDLSEENNLRSILSE